MTDRQRIKAAPRAARTSDVARPRVLALAALGAAAGGAIVLATTKTPLGEERPLARPHGKNGVTCEKCHSAAEGSTPAEAAAFTSAGACKTCHGPMQHASTRAGHKALAAKGELRCATCHPAHAGAQGVTFGDDGTFVRWGAGIEAPPGHVREGAAKPQTTIPLVSLAACAKCHDPSRASDPIARCVAAETRADPTRTYKPVASLCFDEHKTFETAGARFVAWDAARDVATSTPWLAPQKKADPPWFPLGGAAGGALALGLVASALERRKASPAKTAIVASLGVPQAKKKLPVVDTSTCLGCYACVDACPFDVLQIERYVAVVARPEECCGVVLCEQVCPNGSLRIDEGAPVLDLPAVDEDLESKDVHGLFLAGDLTGLPLIKNAINQGVRAIDGIAATLPRRRSEPLDVIVIGAGPAGLSAALRAKEKGLACVVLEQATIAASVKSFPRDKIVYDPPLDLPVEGALWLEQATKEELLAQWTRIVRARSLDVREGHRVTSITKDGEAFSVTTVGEPAPRAPQTFRASRVVVAIGRRGTPRMLDLQIEPGAEDRIAYALADARSFAGKRVVVVGLGDAAMEAAIALARQPETAVTISYRGASFKRGKQRNVAELQDLVAKGKVKLLFETVPVSISRAAVTLASTADGRGERAPRGRRTVQADAMLVLIGGVPSWDLLTSAGIVRRAKPP